MEWDAKIRLFLWEGQRPSLGNLARALAEEGDMRVIGRALPTEDGLGLLTSAQPDVLLVALSGVEYGGVSRMVQAARQRVPGMALVGVGQEEDVPGIYLAASLGADACLFLDASAEYVADVIRRVYQGERPIKYELLTQGRVSAGLEAWLHASEVVPAFNVPCPLSPRELQMLQGVARGSANKQIARGFGLSEQTVKNHITSILRKSGAHDRAHAVVLALRHGWMSLE